MFHQGLGCIYVLARPPGEVVQRGTVLVQEVLELRPVLVLGAERDDVVAGVLDRPVDQRLGLLGVQAVPGEHLPRCPGVLARPHAERLRGLGMVQLPFGQRDGRGGDEAEGKCAEHAVPPRQTLRTAPLPRNQRADGRPVVRSRRESTWMTPRPISGRSWRTSRSTRHLTAQSPSMAMSRLAPSR